MRNFSIQWKITLLSAVGLLSAVILLIGLSVYALQSTKGLVLEQTDKKIKEDAVQLVLGRGEASQTVWTCDLSHDYVSINADYRS